MNRQYTLKEVHEIAEEAIKIYKDISGMTIKQSIAYAVAAHEKTDNESKYEIVRISLGFDDDNCFDCGCNFNAEQYKWGCPVCGSENIV